MGSALLDIHALRQTFPRAGGGELLVLDGIELQLMEGQIVGLLGRSASGERVIHRSLGLKDPLLRRPLAVAARATRPSAIERRLGGETPRRHPQRRAE